MSLGGRCQLVTVNQVNMKFKVPIEFGLQLSWRIESSVSTYCTLYIPTWYGDTAS